MTTNNSHYGYHNHVNYDDHYHHHNNDDNNGGIHHTHNNNSSSFLINNNNNIEAFSINNNSITFDNYCDQLYLYYIDDIDFRLEVVSSSLSSPSTVLTKFIWTPELVSNFIYIITCTRTYMP